jgi:hypothetical protein
LAAYRRSDGPGDRRDFVDASHVKVAPFDPHLFRKAAWQATWTRRSGHILKCWLTKTSRAVSTRRERDGARAWTCEELHRMKESVREVVRLVMGRGLMLALAEIATSVAASFGATQLMSKPLFGV